MNTPIYDQLRQEFPIVPLCQICGRPCLDRIVDEHLLVCARCYEMDRAGSLHMWHCQVCGRYVEGADRIASVHVEGRSGNVSYTVVCVDDYKEPAA